MMARKALRKKARDRYIKHFDRVTVSYYYEDTRTGKTSWEKPKSLGNYDIDGEDGWVSMTSSDGERYYYNPLTWEMSWDVPYMVRARGLLFLHFSFSNG